MDEEHMLSISVIHPESAIVLQTELTRLAVTARKFPKEWKAFWSLKNAFHKMRFSYALTSHRAQGSTYKQVFVDTDDILANSNRQESLKSLYVGVSRPSERLILT